MGKFLKQIFGPIHFKSRFLPLLEYNKESIHHSVFLVDHIELYNDYLDKAHVISIDELRKDHSWSNEKEIIYKELDEKKYIKNFFDYYMNQYPLPLNVMRFGFKNLVESGELNIVYIGNNNYMTNKNEIIENYFQSIPVGAFHYAPQGGLKNYTYPFGDDDRQFRLRELKPKLEERFPDIKFPSKSTDAECYIFGVHFKTKEEGLLFYEIWDYLMYLLNLDTEFLFSARNRGYTQLDQIVGYLIEIFKVNFNYATHEFLEFWSNNTLGWHLTSPHDTMAYGMPMTIKAPDGLTDWVIPYCLPDDDINSMEDYNIKHREKLMWYYEMRATHINFKFDEDKKMIVITHKNL